MVLLLAIAAVSCDTGKLTDALDNFAPVIGLESINTTGVVQLSDAASGDLIDVRTTVSFENLSGGAVIDMYSDPLLTVSVRNGFVNFGIPNELEPSEENPVSIRMQFTAPGYQTLTRTFRFTETGSSEFVARLVRTANPPSGVIIGTGSGGSSSESGETNDDVVIRPSGATGTGVNPDSPETEVQIPQGSVLTDSSGQPLTGALTVSTQFFDPTVSQALNALPEELREAAEANNGLVLAAAEMSITDASGRRATRIGTGTAGRPLPGDAGLNAGNGYTIEFLLPTVTVDAYLQQLMLVIFSATIGDRLEAIALFELIGTLVTITPSESIPWFTKLTIQMNDELPIQYMLLAGLGNLVCEGEIIVNRNGNSGLLDFEAFRSGALIAGTIPSIRSRVSLTGFLEGSYAVRITNAVTTAELGAHDFCTTPQVTIDLPAPPPTRIDSRVNLILQCTNPSERLRVTDIPGASVFFRAADAPSGTTWRRATDLAFDYNPGSQALLGGKFTMNQVDDGKTYLMRIIYDTEEETGEIVITGTQTQHTEIIDSDLCS